MELLGIQYLALPLPEMFRISRPSRPAGANLDEGDSDIAQHRHDVRGIGVELPHLPIDCRITVGRQVVGDGTLHRVVLHQMCVISRGFGRSVVPLTAFFDEKTTLVIPGPAAELVDISDHGHTADFEMHGRLGSRQRKTRPQAAGDDANPRSCLHESLILSMVF